MAQQALRSSNFGVAEQQFRAVLALDPRNSEARAKLGFAQFLQGDWAGAAENLQEVLKAKPNLANVRAVLGMCQQRLGQPAKALRSLQEAFPHLHAGALQTQVGLELAGILYQRGDLNRVVDVVRILLPYNPKNVDVHFIAAQAYADLADRSRDALAAVAPNSARMHQLMAEFLINLGDTHAAIIQYRKALQLEPKLGGVHYELGEAILRESRDPAVLQAAEKAFRAALAENPADANAEYRLGTVYELKKDYKTAIQHYLRALQLQPRNAYAQQALGQALIEIGEPEKALGYLLAAARLDPLYATTYYQLGMLYRQLGRKADARRELRTFERLEDLQNRINQVYQQMGVASPENDLTGPNTPESPRSTHK